MGALAGIGLMIIAVPFQGMIMSGIQKSRKRAVKYTDARIARSAEAINHAATIKLFGASVSSGWH